MIVVTRRDRANIRTAGSWRHWPRPASIVTAVSPQPLGTGPPRPASGSYGAGPSPRPRRAGPGPCTARRRTVSYWSPGHSWSVAHTPGETGRGLVPGPGGGSGGGGCCPRRAAGTRPHLASHAGPRGGMRRALRKHRRRTGRLLRPGGFLHQLAAVGGVGPGEADGGRGRSGGRRTARTLDPAVPHRGRSPRRCCASSGHRRAHPTRLTRAGTDHSPAGRRRGHRGRARHPGAISSSRSAPEALLETTAVHLPDPHRSRQRSTSWGAADRGRTAGQAPDCREDPRPGAPGTYRPTGSARRAAAFGLTAGGGPTAGAFAATTPRRG